MSDLERKPYCVYTLSGPEKTAHCHGRYVADGWPNVVITAHRVALFTVLTNVGLFAVDSKRYPRAAVRPSAGDRLSELLLCWRSQV